MLVAGIKQQKLNDLEDEFMNKLSKTLLSSVVDQQGSRLPASVNEEIFENILRSAFSKLPDSELKDLLLTNLTRHTVKLYKR